MGSWRTPVATPSCAENDRAAHQAAQILISSVRVFAKGVYRRMASRSEHYIKL